MLEPRSSAADSMKRFVGGSEADTAVRLMAGLCLNIQNVWYFDVLSQGGFISGNLRSGGGGVGVGTGRS